MLKLWNFSSTLGRPNSEEKERKRRLREAQLQQIQRELTLDRKLISSPLNNAGPWRQPAQRAKTFRHSDQPVQNDNHLRFRSKSTHKLDEDQQFVSRLRFFDNSNSSPSFKRHSGNSSFLKSKKSGKQSSDLGLLDFENDEFLPLKKRHSSAFLTPGDDGQDQKNYGHDLFYGMRRRYNTNFDSEDTDFTSSTTNNGQQPRANMVTFANTNKIRFSDQLGDTTSAGTLSFGNAENTSEDDGFGFDYNSSRSVFSIYPFVAEAQKADMLGKKVLRNQIESISRDLSHFPINP